MSLSEQQRDSVVSEQQLMEKFRPVLELLWPEIDLTNEKENEDSRKLIKFFHGRGIQEMKGLAVFDEDHFFQKRSECDLFGLNIFCFHLGLICEYICIFGVASLLELKAKHDGDDAFDKMEELVEENHNQLIESRDNHRQLDQEVPDNMFLHEAREMLKGLLRVDIFTLMSDKTARDEWLSKGALKILSQHPILASEENFLSYGIHGYPLKWFLWGGFESEIINKVLSHYPDAARTTTTDEFHRVLQSAKSRDIRVSLDVFQRLLKIVPRNSLRLHAVADRSPWLVEWLFYFGYEASVVLGFWEELPLETDELFLSRESAGSMFLSSPWSITRGSSAAFDQILPHLRRLSCEPESWEDGCFESMMNMLSKPEYTSKLEELSLSVPIHNFRQSQTKALICFLEGKRALLKKLKLVYPLVSLHHERDISYGSLWLGVVTQALRKIHQKSSNYHWYLESFTLAYFDLDECNDVQSLLSLNLSGSFDFQVDAIRYECPWSSSAKKTDDVLIERLNFHRFRLVGDPELRSLTSSIPLATKMEKVLISPGHQQMPQKIGDVVEALASISMLNTLCLCPHWDDEEIVDITDPLVSMLEHGSLEFLQIEGSFETDEGDIHCLGYQIEVDRLCRALRNNKTLQFLFLRGVKLLGTNVTQSLLDVFQEYNNTTIEFADVCDDKYFYTIIPKDSWRRDLHHGFKYESFAQAWQIYYLTCFNRYGRSKVRDRSSTVDDLIPLLVHVHPGVNLDGKERSAYQKILQLADESWESPLDYLNHLYLYLSESPRSWYNAVKRELETFSLRYDLLRESPSLWCVRAINTKSQSENRKRKRGANDS